MNTIMEELERTATTIKRELAAYEPYEFAQEWPWNETLRRLEREQHGGHTSLLWRRFLHYDEARKAYEAAYAQRQRWQRDLVQIRRHIHEVEHEQDPDTIDYAALVQAK